MRSAFFWSVIVAVSIVFSAWLMWHTFSFSVTEQKILVSDKIWSDFGNHLPLIRSFSWGENWLPENPLFPGEKIRYHFLFFSVVGYLEKLGLRLDWALNLPSIIGFSGLMISLAILAYKLFSSRLVALLSVLFFVFNGSLSFVKYFSKFGFSAESIASIFSNSQFVSFGPWDGGTIAAIWNLNIYTNQRHLAPSMALAFLSIILINTRKNFSLLLSLMLGLALFINQAIFGALIVILAVYFIFFKSQRIELLKTAIFTLPYVFLSFYLVQPSGGLAFQPGFLVSNKLEVMTFIGFWFANMGFHLILIPIGILLAPKPAKVLGIGIGLIFLIGNLFQLSPDMFNNHKLFNIVVILGGMFSAYVISKLFKKIVLAPLACVLIVLITFSGLIDFYPIKNDRKLSLDVSMNNRDLAYIVANTLPEDVVLNSTFFYHPASLAGRPIFNGYTYFTWSHGYDSFGRESVLKSIYRSQTIAEACSLLRFNRIEVVELNDRPEEYVEPNLDLWSNIQADYSNPATGVNYYHVKRICSY